MRFLTRFKIPLLIFSCILIASTISFLIYKKFHKKNILDMSDLDEVEKSVVSNLQLLGITNQFMIAGILGVSMEETQMKPRRESSYSNTSALRLKLIFPTRLANLSDDEIDLLKKDDIAFFDKIYGNELGNINSGDGWKYRGGGINQITFKYGYETYGKKIGVDLISDPDQIVDTDIAAKVLAYFFKDGIDLMKKRGMYVTPTSTDEGAEIAFQINAGLGKNINSDYLASRLQLAKSSANEYTGDGN